MMLVLLFCSVLNRYSLGGWILMNRDKVIIMRQLIVNCFARLNTVRKEDKLQVEVVRNLSIQ